MQFFFTACYSSAAAFACWMELGEIPASLAAVKALPLIPVSANFHHWVLVAFVMDIRNTVL